MSDDATMDTIFEATTRLRSLLSDPRQGLFSWCDARDKAEKALYGMLGERFAVPTQPPDTLRLAMRFEHDRLSAGVASMAKVLAQKLLRVAKEAEDPKGLLNSLGEIQAAGSILEAHIGACATLRDLLKGDR